MGTTKSVSGDIHHDVDEAENDGLSSCKYSLFTVVLDESFGLRMARLIAIGDLNRSDHLALPHPAEPQLRCMQI